MELPLGCFERSNRLNVLSRSSKIFLSIVSGIPVKALNIHWPATKLAESVLRSRSTIPLRCTENNEVVFNPVNIVTAEWRITFFSSKFFSDFFGIFVVLTGFF